MAKFRWWTWSFSLQKLSGFVGCLKFFVSKNKLENIPKKLPSQSWTSDNSEKAGSVMEGTNTVFFSTFTYNDHSSQQTWEVRDIISITHTTCYTLLPPQTHTWGSKSTLTKLLGYQWILDLGQKYTYTFKNLPKILIHLYHSFSTGFQESDSISPLLGEAPYK